MTTPRTPPSGCGPTYPYDPTVRTTFTDTDARISAWPSHGGVIILDSAEAMDFEFLGLNPLDPPLRRLDDQAAEDRFCRQLLLLGAKWWDSEARYSIVAAIELRAGGGDSGRRVSNAFVLEEQPTPTMREKRLLRVGWPQGEGGGVWIAEFDTTWAGVDEETKLLPADEELGRLRMTRTMNERCVMLRDRFRGRFYTDLREYEGYGFFNSWAERRTGEVGPLLKPEETREMWMKAYYSIGQT